MRASLLAGRSVLVTGHTGFKGSWLCLWLHSLGAKIHGFSLGPPTEPNLFSIADVPSLLTSDVRADLRDISSLVDICEKINPEVIFHLAAQSLVRQSYDFPLETFSTNVLGTANVIEAVRRTNSTTAIVAVATDKVYRNTDRPKAFIEEDPLGGWDPYSASKAAAELIVESYRLSFFGGGGEHHKTSIASARAGNVIGGGDWAVDRLVPDCVRSFIAGNPVILRRPDAIRPWQHVLDPLCGYLILAERLLVAGHEYGRAWNFGPTPELRTSVLAVARLVANLWGDGARVEIDTADGGPHESEYLLLDSSAATTRLDWTSGWSLEESIDQTVSWYKAWREGANMKAMCLRQIAAYQERLR